MFSIGGVGVFGERVGVGMLWFEVVFEVGVEMEFWKGVC